MADEPLAIEDIRQADAIFVGRIVRYEIVSPGQPGSLDDYGLITVHVKDVVKGSLSGDVQLYWWNSTFGMPDTLLSTDPTLFAAVRSDNQDLPLRGASATIFPSRRRDLLQVMQAPCSGAFILPADRTTVSKIRNILRGGSPKSYDPYDFDRGMSVREVTAIRHSEGATGRVVAAITALAGLLVIASLWVWRRNRGAK